MHNYMIYMPGGQQAVERNFSSELHQVDEYLWAVASSIRMPAEVCELLLSGEDENDSTLVVVPMRDYDGYADRALWQKLDAWRNDSDNVRKFPNAKTQPSEIGGGNGGSNYGERIARIEERLNDTATHEDIADVKTLIANLEARIAEREATMLRWVIRGGFTLIMALVAALASLVIMLIKTF